MKIWESFIYRFTLSGVQGLLERFAKIRDTIINSCKETLHSGLYLQKKCKLLFGRYEGCQKLLAGAGSKPALNAEPEGRFGTCPCKGQYLWTYPI
jgi:hypothetical protein